MAKRGLPPKIPHKDYEAIAEEYFDTDITMQVLADRYGVSRERIRQIIEEVRPGTAKRRRASRARRDIEAIWQAVREGAGTKVAIALHTGLSLSRIDWLFRNRTHQFQGLRGLMIKNHPPARLRTEKRCPTCRKVKALDEFYRLRDSADGHGSRCATCVKEEVREYFRNRGDHEPVDHKICPACRRDLPRARFFRATKMTSGLQTYCKECLKRMRKGESVPNIVESHGYEYERRRFN